MIEVLMCPKCGLIHPAYYDGLVCRSKGCDGKLKVVRIFEEKEVEESRKSVKTA